MGEYSLPEPEIVSCACDDRSSTGHSVMRLDWGAARKHRRSWHLPQGLSLTGPPPICFGFSIRRHGPDTYDVQVARLMQRLAVRLSVRGVQLHVDARVAVPEETFLGRQPLHEHIQAAHAHAQIVVAKCVHARQDSQGHRPAGSSVGGQSH